MEYLELQGVLRNGAVISDVENRNNRIYFRIDGHLFHTFGYQTVHEKHPFFDHPISDIDAREHNTPEGIQEQQEQAEESSRSWKLWMKHKTSLYKIVMLKAFELLQEKGEDAFVECLEHHFLIMEEGDNCQPLIKLLEKS